ncbi:MAG: glucose-1-phosphate adenylyltransferase [Candidatus Aminicenantes bacterium]|nr:glucose-1-phosphate adenylyltransferase [Candidatus Aminicenantes bacterium]
MKDVIAVILGGGQGTRLYPLTRLRAKPAVPIGGKFRLIDIPISNCIHAGVKKIFILTQFNTMSLHKHITNTYKFDGFSKGFLHILAAQQTLEDKNWYQGTADAVRQNLRYLKSQKGKYVVILSGDQLYRINIRDFVNFHIGKQADITIASKPISRKDAEGLGLLKINHDRKIVDFAEKPEDPKVIEKLFNPEEMTDSSRGLNYLASMGIYIFNKDLLIEILENDLREDFGKEIIPDAIRSHSVYSYIFDHYWEDIGTIKSFFEANLDFASPVPKFNFYDEDEPIFTNARFLPSSKISRSEITNSLISEGAIIDDSIISNCVIGVRSIIKKGTNLERVIMMGADFYSNQVKEEKEEVGVGERCRLKNVIIDKNVRIGDDVVIDYKGKNQPEGDDLHIVDGIVVLSKNAVVPSGTKII